MGQMSKCCAPLWLFSWIVLIIGTTLATLLILKNCTIYHEITMDLDDDITYIFTLIAIILPTSSALVYIIVTTYQDDATPMCIGEKLIWLALHLGLCMLAGVKNFIGQIYTGNEMMSVLNKSSNRQELPNWFTNLQTRMNCCGIEDSGDYGRQIPETLISTCNLHGNSAVEIKGCRDYLNDTFYDCRTTSIIYIVIMACLDVIPFLIMEVTYQLKLKAIIIRNAELEQRRQLRKKSQDQLNNNDYTSSSLLQFDTWGREIKSEIPGSAPVLSSAKSPYRFTTECVDGYRNPQVKVCGDGFPGVTWAILERITNRARGRFVPNTVNK